MNIKNELKRTLIPLGISLIILLTGVLLLSTIYYFNIIGNKVFTVFQLLLPLVSFMIGGIIIGRSSKKKGWLEGLKLGLLVTFLMFLVSFLGFNHGLNLTTTIYYSIIIAITVFGSMIGINYQKKD